MKIAIIGYSGCGKSTLAGQLSQKYNIPVLHLDSVHWLPNWVENNSDDENTLVGNFLDENNSWVIDGNYSNIQYQRRLELADKIICLELNRFICFWRVFKRYLKYRGKTRFDMGEGCNEKLDWQFIRWVLHDGRNRSEKYRKIEELYPEKVIRVKNLRQQKNLKEIL